METCFGLTRPESGKGDDRAVAGLAKLKGGGGTFRLMLERELLIAVKDRVSNRGE